MDIQADLVSSAARKPRPHIPGFLIRFFAMECHATPILKFAVQGTEASAIDDTLL